MGLSLKVEHLKRYRDIAGLLWKYGRSDFVKSAGLDQALDAPPAEVDTGSSALAEPLAKDLEALGPTYVKLGQLLSTRGDLLPIPFIEALARLQDHVKPFAYEEAEKIVTGELGVRMSKAFSEFDREPLAAASLGQVYRAALRDGREVAVKVQRPDIRERIVADLEALAEIAQFADKHTDAGRRYGFGRILDEFRKTLMKELDYRQEARNLATLRENMKEFEHILVPAPIDDYTTSRVLTAEYIKGRKVTDLPPIARTELDGGVLARELFHAYLKQTLLDGFLHADPHPGNVLLTEDDRIALIDLGMVSRIDSAMQERLLELLLAISNGKSDEAASLAIKIGERKESFDELEFRRRSAEIVTLNQDASVSEMQVGKTLLLMTRASADCGIAVPSELTMLGKTLLHLDQIGRALDPSFQPNQAIRETAAELMRKRMQKSASSTTLFTTLMEARELLERMPRQLSRVLDTIAANELRLNVDAIDEKLLMEGFQKVANRITLGLVLAALIVGASILARVESSWTILGYPAIAIIFFVAAGGAGLFLVITILMSDQKAQRKKHSTRPSP
jgi:predicted unusual protein kinase regulating ubiquinone biosynthesis (AarF/ABC1/UbiB family)